MHMFKKMTIALSHVCVEGFEVGSSHPHFMIPLTGSRTYQVREDRVVPTTITEATAGVIAKMHDDISGEWVYSSSLSPELLASPEFKAAVHEAVCAFKERIIRRGPGRDVPDVVGTACYVIRWEGDQ